MKNLGVLISESFFLSLAPWREARQGISRSIGISRTLIDLEVVSRELLGPVDLAGAQTLCINELMEVVVVSEVDDLVCVAFQVVAPSLRGFNNSQELLVMGFVPSLSGDHLSREKGYWVPLANFGLWKIRI